MRMLLSAENRERLEITHLGKTLSFDISNFGRTKLVKDGEDFREINNFYSRMEPDRQQNIFNVYERIKVLYEVAMVPQELQEDITKLVTELYSYVTLDEMREYIRFHATVVYPTGLKENYDASDSNRERTYLKREYPGLVLLVLATRLMIPIWGEYLCLNLKRVGSMKEYHALKLISNTEIISCPEMMRLRSYVETTGISKMDRDNAIIRGISSEELPEYILGTLIVRELSIGSIDASKEGTRSIITNVFARVRNAVRDISRRPTQVQEKFKLDDAEGEDNSSRLEQYKNVQSVSDGDIEIHKFFVNQPEVLAAKVDPTIDPEKLKQCLTLSRRLGTFDIDNHNVLLVQWVLSRKVPARVIRELTASELLGVMAVTQALLWHWGFFDLALMVTSALDTERLPITNSSRKQAKKQTTQILNELFPYQANTASKSNSKNCAHRACDEYEKAVRNHFLLARYPAGLRIYFEEVSNKGDWTCPSDLLTQLTDLLVHVHKTMRDAEIERNKQAVLEGLPQNSN